MVPVVKRGLSISAPSVRRVSLRRRVLQRVWGVMRSSYSGLKLLRWRENERLQCFVWWGDGGWICFSLTPSRFLSFLFLSPCGCIFSFFFVYICVCLSVCLSSLSLSSSFLSSSSSSSYISFLFSNQFHFSHLPILHLYLLFCLHCRRRVSFPSPLHLLPIFNSYSLRRLLTPFRRSHLPILHLLSSSHAELVNERLPERLLSQEIIPKRSETQKTVEFTTIFTWLPVTFSSVFVT